MSKLNTVLAGVIIALMGLGLSVPAAAQFEVAPDHFPDSAPVQAKEQISKQDQSLNYKIAELQSELDGYQWQINQRASVLEAARRLADGPGGEGEFAPIFIDEYLLRFREMEQLKQHLAPLIRIAQDSIRQLESQVASDSSPTHTSDKQSKHTQQPIVLAASRTKRQQRPLIALVHR